jgi:hypothetical protein
VREIPLTYPTRQAKESHVAHGTMMHATTRLPRAIEEPDKSQTLARPRIQAGDERQTTNSVIPHG